MNIRQSLTATHSVSHPGRRRGKNSRVAWCSSTAAGSPGRHHRRKHRSGYAQHPERVYAVSRRGDLVRSRPQPGIALVPHTRYQSERTRQRCRRIDGDDITELPDLAVSKRVRPAETGTARHKQAVAEKLSHRHRAPRHHSGCCSMTRRSPAGPPAPCNQYNISGRRKNTKSKGMTHATRACRR